MAYTGPERRSAWRLFLDKLGLRQIKPQAPVHPNHDLKK